ncbi:MAG: alcohol dehydrogenase [Candidatus Paceibacteria bacterium]|jgi:alcohol dehydrogenase
MTDFRIPTHVRVAPGCSAALSETAKQLNAKRVLFITDAGLLEGPLVFAALALLDAANMPVELYGEVESNPRTTTAEHIASLANPGDVLVGFGGGSVIDAAKAAAMLATNKGGVGAWLGKNVFDEDPLPFIAVPTTCGTGSEVTWVSVLTDEARNIKISIKGTQMFPSVALVDADLIGGLPAHLIVSTGLDALTHALEATTGSVRNPVSDAMAEKSIALTFEFLARAARDPKGDGEAREAIMRASTLAGLAFGNADVAGVHCLSESLGGLYDVPHGLANALLLAPVMRSHGKHVEGRLRELKSLCLRRESTQGFMDQLETLIGELNLPDNSCLGIVAGEERRIAELAVANGSNGSNPRVMGIDEYLAILEEL